MPKWSMPEVENAIKAAFFSKAADAAAAESLRFTEVRAIIGESRPISDRTLSKGLRRLVEQGQLKKHEDRSYERSVTWELKDRMDVILAADRLSIDAGASVGVVGDQSAGWTFYGVPRGKPRELRPRLRRAAVRFQEEVDEILWEAAEQTVNLTLAKARDRGLSRGGARNIKRILLDIFGFWESLRWEQLDSFAWVFITEKIAPGAFPKFIEKLLKPPLGVWNDLNAGVPVHESMAKRPNEWIPYLARMFIEDQETIRGNWDRLLTDAEAGARAYDMLRNHLKSRDWKLFGKQWSSIISARYWSCAVIR